MAGRMIKTEPSKVAIILSDESGYVFNLDAERDKYEGWSLSVTLESWGSTSWQAEMPSLLNHAKHLVRMLEKEVQDETLPS